MSQQHPLQSKLESLLFVEGKPMTLKRLATVLKAHVGEVENAAKSLQRVYQECNAGISLVMEGDTMQLMSAPDNATFITEYLEAEQAGELTRPSLETLTIIAYRGPVSKTEIELIRGVNCSLILRNLQIRGLVNEVGESESGSPLFRVTVDFLRLLGVNKSSDLPDYVELNKNVYLDELLSKQLKEGDFFAQQNKTDLS